ncbi:hypothetical protein T439DRAFT_306552 [Meredithblackwellia eburnea MCA 4105]
MTLGSPVGSTRATVKVGGLTQSNAITGSCGSCNNMALRFVQVDGSRPTMGRVTVFGSALIEFGGTNTGALVEHVHAFEPRSWSVLHVPEGTSNACSGARILNNEIGPSGHAPSGEKQEKRGKRDTGTYGTGEWADGISMACKGSTVSGNVVTDATDGGIVVFGAPGSTITGNTIVANTRVLMGGINNVDYAPFSGSFAGTVVSGNTIFANTTMIKTGIAVGTMVWGSQNTSSSFTYGGSVTGNTITSGTSGYFGFGIPVAGHNNANVANTKFVKANFGGIHSSSCASPAPPTPQPLIWDPTTSSGAVLQSSYKQASISFLICDGPTQTMTTTNYSA